MSPSTRIPDAVLTAQPPRDVASLVLLSYFALGAGSLVIWNSFVFAFDYFQDAFKDDFPRLQFGSLVSAVTNPCNLLSVLLAITIKHGISDSALVRFGFAGYTATVAVTLAGVSFPGLVSATALLALTLTVSGVCGLLTGLVQGALLGEASRLPLQYTQAIIAGSAASGCIVALLKIATKVSLPATSAGLTESAIAYFSVALAFALGCLAIHAWWLPASHFVQWHVRRHAHAHAYTHELQGSSDSREPLLPELHDELRGKSQSGDLLAAIHPEGDTGEECQSGSHPHLALPGVEQLMLQIQSEQSGPGELAPADPDPGQGRFEALVALWPSALACFLVYLATMSIFPGFLITNAAAHSGHGDWAAIWVITVFNFADMGSRLLPVPHACFRARNLLSLCVLRVAFTIVVVYFSGVFYATAGRGLAVTGVLGASNGYLTSCAMLAGAKRMEGGHHACTGGNFLILVLIMGCVVGSYVGLFLA